MNRAAVCFRWTVYIGILANLFFALPAIFIPNAVIGLVGGEPAQQPIWPAFGGLLLLLLSLFYIPGALNPFRHTASAILSVASRFAGVLFFWCLWRQYPMFGWLDFTFGVVEAVLLWKALRRGPDWEV